MSFPVWAFLAYMDMSSPLDPLVGIFLFNKNEVSGSLSKYPGSSNVRSCVDVSGHISRGPHISRWMKAAHLQKGREVPQEALFRPFATTGQLPAGLNLALQPMSVKT